MFRIDYHGMIMDISKKTSNNSAANISDNSTSSYSPRHCSSLQEPSLIPVPLMQSISSHASPYP